jgi:hypothetical protein
MATIPHTGKKDVELQITQFAGPIERGVMLQLTQGFGQALDEPGFIELMRGDAQRLIPILVSWLEKTT